MCLLIYYKDITNNTDEEMHRVRCGEGEANFHALPGQPLSRNLRVFNYMEALLNSVLPGF